MTEEKIIIGTEPIKLLITSEPRVIYTRRGYQAVVSVFHKKKRREGYIFLSASSLANTLESLRNENDGKMSGLEFWIRKKSAEKMSPYIIEE
jgi:hypothetical protein